MPRISPRALGPWPPLVFEWWALLSEVNEFDENIVVLIYPV